MDKETERYLVGLTFLFCVFLNCCWYDFCKRLVKTGKIKEKHFDFAEDLGTGVIWFVFIMGWLYYYMFFLNIFDWV